MNKTIIKQLEDENRKLKAENVSLLKNHHSSSVDLGKVDIKKEDIKKEIENQESARENFKNQKNSENISSPFYNFQEDKTTRNKKPFELQNLTNTCEYCYNSFRSLTTLNRHIKSARRHIYISTDFIFKVFRVFSCFNFDHYDSFIVLRE